ncbi:M1 family metallopeptidase [Fructobacillus evanidus]|uniref:Aminopeptidase n=1 Tax=Fructobacillus evanidus TaxID=3064281 RepID=A0ABN9YPT6_9LACO|nr:Aminopeptidase N [Fructobacillus sp. LMG 32999]CAK1232004.1 Aminopeptidase N [Fructobacillus sp. LMG 32999]CAK1232580.1 Aminopeptidase N [Fructobacillus sp. LMG 32999]CAK1236020.1 Aminopeptidase N [Fructobacillus sp. LMG 32999]CAK1238481.1 Aminopeptidase N [Fructobacillus sp. LMG 32999]
MAAIPRLYETFQPDHYDLFLDISRENKLIVGKTTITGHVTTTDLALHQHDLVVETLKVNGQAVDFTMDNDQDQVTFKADQAGEIEVEVTYHAPLTDNMNGIYPSYYNVDGQAKQLVSTQFETYFARQAFPSIDEPEAKATFSLAIKFDEKPEESVISNMPEQKVEEGVHYFDKTVKMSTYLLGFALGDLQSKKTKTNSGVEIGVFATKAHPADNLDFSLDIAKRSIEFFEDFYQTPYPLPHSWQVALPDFSAGAMENWGVVTYREACLLVDPKNSSTATKQYVATIVAHELAHQWFGDLVTMKWWDELWLNESFANMMEYVATDFLEPDWHIWESFNAVEVQKALQRDAILGVQPVHVEVKHPEEIDALFDPAIVYAKGGHLLVMVRALIGDDALRNGLKAYFAKKKYSNATGDDLWAALGEASGKNIGEIMHSWLEQPGYPVVSVKVEDGRVKVSQKPFSIGGDKSAVPNADSRIWQVPLAASAASAPDLLTTESMDLGDYETLKRESNGAFTLNVGNTGHYIVQYDDTLLAEQVANLEKANAISQAQFLQNNLLLAQAGQGSFADLLWVLPKLADSTSELVQSLIYQVIGQVKAFATDGSALEKNLKTFVGDLSKQQLARLGFDKRDGESVDDEMVRAEVLSAALFAKNADLVAHDHEVFEQAGGDVTKLPANGRAVVLKNEIQNFNTQEKFNQFLTDYQKTAEAALKSDLEAALVTSQDENQLETLVANYQNADVIKPQDLRGWFQGVLGNDKGQPLAWDWVKNNWEWLEDRLGGDMSFSSYVTVISRIFKTAENLAEFKAFFTPKLDQPGLAREIVIDQAVIENRMKTITDQTADVDRALALLAQK